MYENEQALIKGILSGGKLTQTLSPDDFEAYGDIYEVCERLISQGKKPDFGSVMTQYSDIDKLSDCLRSYGSASMVDDYASIIRRESQRRQAIKILQDTERHLLDPENTPTKVLDKMRERILKLDTTVSGWTSVGDVVRNTQSYLKKRRNGEITPIATGIPNVDKIIGGFFPGELTIIGARPAVGKSAFALAIAYWAALHGYYVGIVSREMTDVQLGSRLIAQASDVLTGSNLRKAEFDDKQWEELDNTVDSLASIKMSFLFGVKNIEDLVRQVRERKEKGKLDFLIVDYLQLMDTSSRYQSDHLRVGIISKALKDISVDYNIPVIALAQVNRDTDGQMPSLKSLKDSGSIEQDADGVIFLHRPMSAEDKSINPDDKSTWSSYANSGRYDYIVIGIAKQRQGSIGVTEVLFDKAYMCYKPIVRS